MEAPPGVSQDGIDLVEPPGPPRAPFEMSLATVEPHQATPAHSHASHELWLISAGEGNLTYDGRCLRVGPGDVVYFEPWKTHHVRNDGEAPLRLVSIWWRSE
jgi:mannose-6-phosphate isomerase-like protein (cupin superfamily)